MDPSAYRQGVEYLQAADPKMAALIAQYGLDCNRPVITDPFLALSRSLIGQQLSTKAAAAIAARFIDYFSGSPNAEQVLQAPTEELRSLGLSGQKIKYLKDLAERSQPGGSLDLSALNTLDDQEVVVALVQVRGIGVWTAQMFLIFGLGRPDVWAVGDLGLRRAVQTIYGMDELPSFAEMEEIGEPWSPYRTVASFYLWQSLQNQPLV